MKSISSEERPWRCASTALWLLWKWILASWFCEVNARKSKSGDGDEMNLKQFYKTTPIRAARRANQLDALILGDSWRWSSFGGRSAFVVWWSLLGDRCWSLETAKNKPKTKHRTLLDESQRIHLSRSKWFSDGSFVSYDKGTWEATLPVNF